jgi:uncharacterized membrane protein SpoIIM required for sporulation
MIIDIPRFIENERPYWQEFEALLDRMEAEPIDGFAMEEIKRFHFLYERCAADLARLTPQAEPETHKYLENLVTRAYGEIHESPGSRARIHPLRWFFHSLPQTFRRHSRAFLLSCAITLIGALFGAGAVAFDPEAKQVILPFAHLHGDPADRVAEEEASTGDHMEGGKSAFSAYLMTNNTKVSILAMALGMTWGVGTVVVLFYNGSIIGAVGLDYVRAGQTEFLLGWLLPHGSIEIPAILIGGQAGLVLAGALIGWGNRQSITARIRAVGKDVITLIFGVAIMMVWAGLVESFLSQYHAPVFPYWAKITLGMVELILLYLFLARAGRKKEEP